MLYPAIISIPFPSSVIFHLPQLIQSNEFHLALLFAPNISFQQTLASQKHYFHALIFQKCAPSTDAKEFIRISSQSLINLALPTPFIVQGMKIYHPKELYHARRMQEFHAFHFQFNSNFNECDLFLIIEIFFLKLTALQQLKFNLKDFRCPLQISVLVQSILFRYFLISLRLSLFLFLDHQFIYSNLILFLWFTFSNCHISDLLRLFLQISALISHLLLMTILIFRFLYYYNK